MKYYKLTNINGLNNTSYVLNKIYPETYSRETYCSTVKKMVEKKTGNFTLSTKKEYDIQEGIVSVPKVKKEVIEVGSKVQYLGGDSWAKSAKCDIGEIYTVSVIDGEYLKVKEDDSVFWLRKECFKLIKKEKTMKMKDFSIEGSVALKKAFVEECKLEIYTSGTIRDNKYLTSVDMTVGTVQGTGTKYSMHFILPQNWDEAVKYVKEFLKPDQPEFKVCGYESKLDKENKSVSFGCKTISKKQVEAVITAAELCNYIGFTAKVTSDGIKFIDVSAGKNYLTLEELKQILKAIK